MKKLAIVLSLVLGISLFALLGNAQNASSPASSAAPSAQYKQPPGLKMIWDYKKQLEMSDGQEAGLKEAIQNYQTKDGDLITKLKQSETELQQMIANKGDMEQIHKKLQEGADLQIQRNMLDIETARKIDTILTPYQMSLWHEIQKREIAKEQQEAASAMAAKNKQAASSSAKTNGKAKSKAKRKP